MSAALVTLALIGSLAAPHLMRSDDATPMLAAVTWLAALSLRAVLAVFAGLFLLLVAPSTELFHQLTHWCWHNVLPLAMLDRGVSGHAVGHVAAFVPIVGVAAAAGSVTVALRRATQAVGRLRSVALTGGPHGSLIIRDPSILIAAAGLRHPQVVVSAGALATLDDAELYAGLAHERGHIRRRHRWLLVAGTVCASIGRILPGTRRAADEFAFHLERDADRYALACAHEPVALARAICKAAESAGEAYPESPLIALGGNGAARRVAQLIQPAPPRRRATGLAVVAASLVALTFALAVALPVAVVHAAGSGPGAPDHHCLLHLRG